MLNRKRPKKIKRSADKEKDKSDKAATKAQKSDKSDAPTEEKGSKTAEKAKHDKEKEKGKETDKEKDKEDKTKDNEKGKEKGKEKAKDVEKETIESKHKEAKDKDKDTSKKDPVKPRQKIELKFPEYKRISNMLVIHMRRQEEKGQGGVKESTLVNWYLSSIENAGEEDLIHHAKLIRAVIRRLIDIDHILLIAVPADERDDRVLEVHPNYDPEGNLEGHATSGSSRP